MIERCHSLYLLILSLYFLSACASEKIVIQPAYKPQPRASYSTTSFAQEWAQASGVKLRELIVLNDVLSKPNNEMHWDGFWKGFADREFAPPSYSESWDTLLQGGFPKCTSEAINGFALFSASDFQSDDLESQNLILMSYLLDGSCDLSASAEILQKMKLKLLRNFSNSDLDQDRARASYLSVIVNKLKALGQVETLIEPQDLWMNYFQSALLNQPMVLLESSKLAAEYDRVFRLYSKDSSPMIVQIISEEGLWDSESISRASSLLGNSQSLLYLHENANYQGFSTLSANQKYDFLQKVFEILNQVSQPEALDFLPVFF